MTKTLAVILNYNTPELTNQLYESLKPYERDDYDLIVLDNASSQDGVSKYTSYQLEQNVYFGGGLNAAIQLTLESSEYDSLLFLNSDLIVHGYHFVKTLRNAMLNEDYKILSPAIIQPEPGQCYWKTMHNWGSSKIRQVPWIDFQCPLINIDVLKKIVQFDVLLNFGWGNDVYAGLVCEDNNWRIGVLDYTTAIHLNSYTIKKFSTDPIIKNYNGYAESNMISYFKNINRYADLIRMRELAKNYSFAAM